MVEITPILLSGLRSPPVGSFLNQTTKRKEKMNFLENHKRCQTCGSIFPIAWIQRKTIGACNRGCFFFCSTKCREVFLAQNHLDIAGGRDITFNLELKKLQAWNTVKIGGAEHTSNAARIAESVGSLENNLSLSAERNAKRNGTKLTRAIFLSQYIGIFLILSKLLLKVAIVGNCLGSRRNETNLYISHFYQENDRT